MEALAIIFWTVVLLADIAFMFNIRRIANEWFPVNKPAKKQPIKHKKMADAVRVFTEQQQQRRKVNG